MIGGVDIAINNDHIIDDNYVKVTIPEGIGKGATYDLYVKKLNLVRVSNLKKQ